MIYVVLSGKIKDDKKHKQDTRGLIMPIIRQHLVIKFYEPWKLFRWIFIFILL